MKIPPFSQMYYLKGTLVFLVQWFVLVPIVLHIATNQETRDTSEDWPVFFFSMILVGLFVSPIMGIAYSSILKHFKS